MIDISRARVASVKRVYLFAGFTVGDLCNLKMPCKGDI